MNSSFIRINSRSALAYILPPYQHVPHEPDAAVGLWRQVELACGEIELTALREHLVHVESGLDLRLDGAGWHLDDVVLL